MGKHQLIVINTHTNSRVGYLQLGNHLFLFRESWNGTKAGQEFKLFMRWRVNTELHFLIICHIGVILLILLIYVEEKEWEEKKKTSADIIFCEEIETFSL